MSTRVRILRGMAVVGLLAVIAAAGFSILQQSRLRQGTVGGRFVSPSASERTVEVGETGPDFTVTGEDGEPLRLSSLRGHWVVLPFVRAHW